MLRQGEHQSVHRPAESQCEEAGALMDLLLLRHFCSTKSSRAGSTGIEPQTEQG